MIWDYCENSEIMYIRGPALDGTGINEIVMNLAVTIIIWPLWVLISNHDHQPRQAVSTGEKQALVGQSCLDLHPSNSTEPALDTGWLKAWIFNLNWYFWTGYWLRDLTSLIGWWAGFPQPLLIKCQKHPSLIVTTKMFPGIAICSPRGKITLVVLLV